MKILTESQYDWAVLPEDLPARNLVLITAKTPHPTYHKEDVEHPVRLFTTQELHEAARSLAHRPIGLNHQAIIAKAFTVDAQYNQSTSNVEALCYFPDEWIGKVRHLLKSGKESIFSVEYTWRDEKETADGVEFVGLIFDKVDLLCGVNAGDKHTSARLVESAFNISFNNGVNRHGYCEAEVSFPSSTQETAISEAVANPSLDFFKECECEASEFLQGKHLEECDAVTHSMGERLGEPFAGYADFSACVRANKDKGSPERYCGYIKHKVECMPKMEDKVNLAGVVKDPMGMESKENLKGEPVSRNPEEASKNPNLILGVDNKPIPKQRPNETNLLNNEPFTPVVNQDPPVVEKPIMNVMSAGFTQGTIGPEGAKNSNGPLGIEPSKEKPDYGMSGSTVARTADDKKLVNKDEHGSLGNAETLPAYSMGKGGVGQSMGASTSEANPIHEVFKTVDIKGTGKESTDSPVNQAIGSFKDMPPQISNDPTKNMERVNVNVESNPVVDGLNNVEGPDKSNEDTYNQKEGEKCLTESEKLIEKPAAQPVVAPAVVEPAPLDYKKLYESADVRVKELEPVVQKLQEAAKIYEAAKKEALVQGYKQGKQETISKIKTVIPVNTLVGGVGVGGAFRALANDLNKKVYEVEHS